MVENITRMWEGLKLTDEEQQKIILSEEIVTSSKNSGKHSLLDMLINEKPANREAFRSTLAKVCNFDGLVTFKEVGINNFMLEFQFSSNKEKIMQERPLSFG